ncbi:MAG: sigma-54 dependent transcriptional regulator [Bacteroidales bacterium]|nr:sigma-54 dependent transcriptional regulator [Bacteroidales bacterium]
MAKKKILVIDDEKSIRNSLREILENENYKVTEAIDGPEGIDQVRHYSFDAILLDIKMPQMDGIEVLERMNILTDAPVVMISGHGNIETAVDAIKKGAYDFIEKPLDLNRLLITIRNALDKSNLVNETKNLKRKVSAGSLDMIGESEAIQGVKKMIERVAPTDARVLIRGSNGTGKELVARWLHDKSHRADEPFIEVNCAAIPSELIESELFGHEKGSFTSAHKQRKGDFEQAHGGTLFLDEIGDMSLAAQAKVLRALEENKVTRVGGDKDIEVDVRVIAASNKNLQKEITKGRFREDLYHRLSVIIIQVPELKERKEDIPLLARHFIDDFCKAQGKAPMEITDEAIEELKNNEWTGNIRELRNVIERLVILCDNEITADDVKRFAMPLN